MDVELFDRHDERRLAEALAVRFVVFVDEQRVPAEEEVDAHDRTDADARHALVRDGGTVVAAGRYYRRDATIAQIGRMAVLAAYRSRGVGRLLLDALLDDARARGFTRASLERAGPRGRLLRQSRLHGRSAQRFYECEILHQPMELALA